MIYFRTDANPTIGMGHIMRCMSIACELQSLGELVTFILSDNNCSEMIRREGYEIDVLNTDYSNLNDESYAWPVLDRSDIVIVDSYFVNQKYLAWLRQKAKVVYIDDLLGFPYPVDVLINYNIYANALSYKKMYNNNKMPQLVLGPKYAPLRSIFCGLPKKRHSKSIQRILISTGGSDTLGLSLQMVKTIKERPTEDKQYHIFLGFIAPSKI